MGVDAPLSQQSGAAAETAMRQNVRLIQLTRTDCGVLVPEQEEALVLSGISLGEAPSGLLGFESGRTGSSQIG
eukprot:4854081-Amphidinium_carterae.1